MKKLGSTKMDLSEALQGRVAKNEETEEKTKPSTKKKKTVTPVKTDNTDSKYTGVFDLSSEDVYFISAANRSKRSLKREASYQQSVYLKQDELEHLEKLADKYNTTVSSIIRTLLANAK